MSTNKWTASTILELVDVVHYSVAVTAGQSAGEITKARRPRGAVRDGLIAAGLELARAGGPDAVVLRETTQMVGVVPNAAYRHFADRDELLAAVSTAAMRELAARMAAGTGRVRGKYGATAAPRCEGGARADRPPPRPPSAPTPAARRPRPAPAPPRRTTPAPRPDPDLPASAAPSNGSAPARTHDLQHRDAMEWLISGETTAAITSYAIRATTGHSRRSGPRPGAIPGALGRRPSPRRTGGIAPPRRGMSRPGLLYLVTAGTRQSPQTAEQLPARGPQDRP